MVGPPPNNAAGGVVPVSDDENSSDDESEILGNAATADDDDTILSERMIYTTASQQQEEEKKKKAKEQQTQKEKKTKKVKKENKGVSFLPDKVTLHVDTYPTKELFESNVLLKLKDYHPSLRKVHIHRQQKTSDRRRTTDEMKSLLDIVEEEHSNSIIELALWNVIVDTSDTKLVTIVCELLLNMRVLEKLCMSIDGCNSSNANAEQLLQAISMIPTLRSLTIHIDNSVQLSKIIYNSNSLEELVIVNRNDDQIPSTAEVTQDVVSTNKNSKKVKSASELVGKEFHYTLGHGMGIIQSLKPSSILTSPASTLRVLDLGRGIGLTTFCVKLLTEIMMDNNTLTDLSFDYNLQHDQILHNLDAKILALKEVNDDVDDENNTVASSNNSGIFNIFKLEEDKTAQEQRERREMLQKHQYNINNRLLEGFIKVLKTNSTLEKLMNHGSKHVRGISDENQQRLIEVLNENLTIQKFKFYHIESEDDDDIGDDESVEDVVLVPTPLSCIMTCGGSGNGCGVFSTNDDE